LKTLCIIPARGGSKRIPRKNIKNFCGKPIIAYSILAALKSGVFDEVMVSTDNEEIAVISKEYGAEIPFFRSEKSSDDYTGLAEVVMEVIQDYKNKGISWDSVCCLLPTAPFVRAEDLKTSNEKYIEQDKDALIPVVRYSYPIQRALQIDDKSFLSFVHLEHLVSRSQDLAPRFHDAGQYYFINKDVLLREKSLFPKNTTAIELPETRVQDIDTAEDWILAELKYRMLSK